MKKIKFINSLLLFILMTSFSYAGILDESKIIIFPDSVVYQEASGMFLDYTGLDGCGMVFKTDLGEVLEIASIVPNTLLTDSMLAKILYVKLSDLASICMVGPMINILNLWPISDSSCQAMFQYTMLRCKNLDEDARCGENSVGFTDISRGDVVSRQWDFGDGELSSEQNPIHMFPDPGIYPVNLIIATKNGCESTFQKDVYVGVVDSGNCKAGFTYDQISLDYYPPVDSFGLPDSTFYTFQFNDNSYGNPIKWKWDFGDGSNSDEQSPYHEYYNKGIYLVCLTIGTENGCESSFCKDVYVGIQERCRAQFAWKQKHILDSLVFGDTIYKGYVVQFTNLSLGTDAEYKWDFGDGTFSDETNPHHLYENKGTYQVMLSMSTLIGCVDTAILEVKVGTWSRCADFDYKEISYAELGYDLAVSSFPAARHIIRFINKSCKNAVDYHWDFGDGTNSSELDPVHFYTYSGTYEVCLTVTNFEGFHDTYCETINLGQSEECKADFEVLPIYYILDSLAMEESLSIVPPVYNGFVFNSISRGDADYYEWDFGDGNVAFEPSVEHFYEKDGIYTVCLLIKTVDGCESSYCQEIRVGQVNQCRAAFEYYPVWMYDFEKPLSSEDFIYYPEYTISFIDASSAKATKWIWDFGNGDISEEQNPMYTYPNPGIYPVCLTITTASGCNDTYCMDVIAGDPNPCEIDFTYCNYSGYFVADSFNTEFVYQFKEQTTGAVSELYWDFGDGTYSYQKNPFHVYKDTGVFNVCLTANTYGWCRAEHCEKVYVGVKPEVCIANFNSNILFPNCAGYEPVFKFNDQSTGNIYEWYWDFGDGNYSYEQNPFHEFNMEDSKEVCLTITGLNGCSDMMCKPVNFYKDSLKLVQKDKCGTTGIIRESDASFDVKVYPVPSIDNVTFELMMENPEYIQIKIMNTVGEVIYQSDETLYNRGSNLVDVNMASLVQGNYYYLIQSESGLKHGQLSIIR